MATQTEINVNVKVDDKQVNTAVKSTENLRKEIRKLEQELTKVEVGSKEFENLSEQLKDNKDKLELVRAKSRDLFDSFSMLPGPIGQIGSSISSTSDKLKIFSAFNLKDIKGQFKAVGDDIRLVAGNLGKATGITKLYEATVGGLSKAFKFFGAASNTASTAAKGFGKALIATGIGAIVLVVGTLIANFETFKKVLLNLIPGLKSVGDAIGSVINFFTDLVGITSEAERAEERRQAQYAKAKANTDIVNQGIQRQIDLLQAQGASQEEVDKLKKQAINNELADLRKATDEKGMLYGEQATKYKDLQNQLAVIDATAKKKAADDAAAAAKTASQKAEQNAQKEAQQRKEFLQSEADAEVQLLKDKDDTNEEQLRQALKKQYALKNEGKKLSVAVQQQQAAEIDRIVKEELERDKENRNKAFNDRQKQVQEQGKIELDTITNDIEAKKLAYGEDSQEYRKAVQEKFDKQNELLNAEETALKEKEKTKDGLTQDEINRLKSIGNERQALTNEIKATNQQQVDSDREKAAKTLENAKKLKDDEFNAAMEANANNFAAQQELLAQKVKQDEEFYAAQEALYAGNKEKLDEIDRARLANQEANAKTEEGIRKAQISLQLRAADAAIQALGAETTAGKVALIAKQFILAKELVLEAKKTIAFSKAALARSKTAVAEGTAQTAKVGFPQNIPLLILYAAQAISIIKTVIDATKSAKEAEAGASVDVGAASVPDVSTQLPRPRGMASGGLVSGPGGGKSDLIPAMLSNGESVINAQSTSLFKPLLSAINMVGGGKGFADGGLAVSNFTNDNTLSTLQAMVSQQTPPIKTYVVSSDMTNQQMLDRNIQSRSTI